MAKDRKHDDIPRVLAEALKKHFDELDLADIHAVELKVSARGLHKLAHVMMGMAERVVTKEEKTPRQPKYSVPL